MGSHIYGSGVSCVFRIRRIVKIRGHINISDLKNADVTIYLHLVQIRYCSLYQAKKMAYELELYNLTSQLL